MTTTLDDWLSMLEEYLAAAWALSPADSPEEAAIDAAIGVCRSAILKEYGRDVLREAP